MYFFIHRIQSIKLFLSYADLKYLHLFWEHSICKAGRCLIEGCQLIPRFYIWVVRISWCIRMDANYYQAIISRLTSKEGEITNNLLIQKVLG